MATAKQPVNPFYVLLVIAGGAFLVTACAYELMAVRALRPREARRVERPVDEASGREQAEKPPDGHVLMAFLDRHGVELMTWELIILGIATAAAMGLDQHRWRRQIDDPRTAGSDAPDRAKNQVKSAGTHEGT